MLTGSFIKSSTELGHFSADAGSMSEKGFDRVELRKSVPFGARVKGGRYRSG